MRDKVINSLKRALQSARVGGIHPTGVIATRGLVLIMLVPILLVVITYILTFVSGYVDDNRGKIISVGINIIDHIFIPSVLTALVGFLALWVDKDGNGIPDRLEEQQRPQVPTNERGEERK
jgi:hypothetical protein|nr:MAG TPA: hypothetical protein [Caudoviricetes sp.]